MGWCACSRKCTRCLESRGGDADGWSASASTLCIPLQPHSSKALPRFSGDVYTCHGGEIDIDPQELLGEAMVGCGPIALEIIPGHPFKLRDSLPCARAQRARNGRLVRT